MRENEITEAALCVPIQGTIERFHYLTGDAEGIRHAALAEEACRGGARWVQLRMKNGGERERRRTAGETMDVCRQYGATFIINDYMELAKALGADGVHLGRMDLSVAEARKALGKNFIIGGTANTLRDILELRNAGADYAGLGPYRYTRTKKNLSPLLGLDGIARITGALRSARCDDIPVIAIGGILPDDVNALMKTGIYGIAVSSAVNRAENRSEAVKKFIERVHNNKTLDTHCQIASLRTK